jgi:hypothetical protein
MNGDNGTQKERPAGPPADDLDVGRRNDEVDELQHELAVANDCGPDAEDGPPGRPPG